MADIAVGQRWASEMEPELGVGIVDAILGRRIHLRFPLIGITRIYAIQSAPIRRIVFHPGDRIESEPGETMTVDAIDSEGGLRVYCGQGIRLREDRLPDTLAVDTPRERLMAGQRDPSALFDLRCRVLRYRHRMARSPVSGFVGGRVNLIPHQFAIAAEVSARRRPRVLLADETGLGKTIEAGLILHRLTVTGRINRILTIVPDALVVQWFVELARRFNLRFRIFDDAFPVATPPSAAGDNPFLDQPLGLCGFSFLTTAPPALQSRLIDAGWDMVVVDEAHHMQPGGPLFQQVQPLAETVERMILITATPGHLSERSHFARLRLLDPDRYTDHGQFKTQSRALGQIARIVQTLADGHYADQDSLQRLSHILGRPVHAIEEKLAQTAGRKDLMRTLIDRHGTGRVMFRNTRRSVGGFPGRRAYLVPLDVDGMGAPMRLQFNREVLQDCGLQPASGKIAFEDDPRVAWLENYLRENPAEKTLLICRTSLKVKALYEALEKRIKVHVGRYHEEMTLVQRDRNAAWFAEPGGAVLLLCSELGSEGRNFQFARSLVLFDLPPDAELLEQRLGRLDRIGQTGVVQVWVPFVRGTGGEILTRWYHEALNAFETNIPAAGWVTSRFFGQLMALIGDLGNKSTDARLDRLIHGGRISVIRQQRRIELERDRLLELDALPPEKVARLMEAIREVDNDPGFLQWVEPLFDVWGIVMEPIAHQVYRLSPDRRYADPLPGFRPAGLTVTTDRARALIREDLGFLTRDHPLVSGAMEHYLGSGKGNAGFACWESAGEPAFLIEMVFLLEAIARPDLYVERFLAPTPFRVVVDHHLNNCEVALPEGLSDQLTDGSASLFAEIVPAFSHRFPDMLEAGRGIAQDRSRPIIEAAHQAAGRSMDDEVNRIEALSRVNAAIGDREITAVKLERDALLSSVSSARMRLDAMRLIVKK
ncbi:RNA polymerase-associated protein RapA [Desulfosarcina sp.]|uniref:RNA polymerase-associated protein RapA n=1 Tax=Desulfosarcina sp. TaxID=2027861 RepID=UPI00356928CE